MLVLPAHYQPSKGVLLLPKEITTAPKTKGSGEPLFPMSSDSVEQSLEGHRKAAYPEAGKLHPCSQGGDESGPSLHS